MFRLPRHLLHAAVVLATTAAAALGGAACGLEGGDDISVAVSVQPRVVLDGVVELADRTAGRVIIDEVIAHASSARLRAAVAGDDGDVVVDGSDPLLFHYLLSDRTGFGAALGGERTWSMPAAGGSLAVHFGAAGDDLFDDDDSAALDGLAGHTAIIHGTIAVETTAAAFGGLSDIDPDGGLGDPGNEHSDVDPDGSPADPEDSSDVDPDGTPADVDPDGGAADVDPDGTPADVDPDGGAADVDPDGTPADVDPDGGAADVDPDGGPALPGEGGTSSGGGGGGTARPASADAPAKGLRRSVVNVPFSLVVDGAFEREVVLTSDDIAGVGCGDVMPIDLHMSAAELLDGERLQTLEEIARDAVRTDDDASVSLKVTGSQTAAATTVSVPGSIKRPKAVRAGSSHIRVSSNVRK
ncbi:MAG: hypothetical protein Q8O67_16445 [Deltaproteobacteria bacterium]|nr:hypothetical protein [Deltaproteobacteria bacterium]